MKIRMKKNKHVMMRLLYLDVVIALYVASDFFSNMSRVLFGLQIFVAALMCVVIVYGINREKKQQKLDKSDIAGLCFFLYALMTVFWDKGRNAYDFYINIYYLFIAFLFYYTYKHYGDIETVREIFDIFKISLWIDFFLVAYQILVLKIDSDFANGIFGSRSFYNGLQCLFCVLCCIIALYLQTIGLQSMKQVVIMIVLSSSICALSEIKAFFFLLVLVCLAYFILEFDLDKKSLKRLGLFLGIVVTLFVSFKVLESMYTANIKVFQDISVFRRYIGYSNGGYDSLSRMGGFINFFDNPWKIVMFGNGYQGQSEYSVYGLVKLLNSLGLVGCFLLCIFVGVNFVMIKKQSGSSTNVHFAYIYAGICLLMMFVSSGIFGSIVSYFSFLFFAILHYPFEKKE